MLLASFLNPAQIKALHLDGLEINGRDPVLPTPFLVGEAGAAALAAVAALSAELWWLKTGEMQTVKVDVREAAVAQRSHTLIRRVQAEVPALWDPISGFYRSQDQRWIQLHCNFSNHRQGVIDFLACENNPAAVAKAILNWQAQALESALHSRGLCASMLRSREQWQASPQYQAIKNLPLYEIIKIADSQPIPLPPGDRPLSGIKVLDLTCVIAGPVTAKTLAEHGATVLRISHPDLPFIEPLIMDTGQGKNNAFLDLRSNAGCETLKNLLTDADIFSQAYRPGAMDSLGFSPEKCALIKPGMIYISLSAYSHQGPWTNRHGYDSLVQSATGIAHEHTLDVENNKPCHLPAQSLDYISGYIGALAAMEALRRRALEGGSYLIRLSLVQTAYWLDTLGRADQSYMQCKIPQREDVLDLLEQRLSDFGLIEYLKPVVYMSKTPPYYSFPSKKLGSSLPVWPI